LLRREGDQGQLVLRAVRIVSRRTQDEKGYQVYIWVALEQLPQEAHVPGRPADDEQHPDAVADHFEHERLLVVLRQRLALVDWHADGEGKLAGPIGDER